MSRYYQVIAAKPLNMNPAGTVLRFMPGETHRLEEYLGQMIFAPNSPYAEYFRLVEIVPPYPVEEVKAESIEDTLKASDVGVMGVFPPTMDEVKTKEVEKPVVDETKVDLFLNLNEKDAQYVEPPLVKTESTKKTTSKSDK